MDDNLDNFVQQLQDQIFEETKKDFGEKFHITEDCCIIAPPVIGNKSSNGFLIFDIHNSEIEAIRI